ncbi:hypothetical protein GCM10010276_56200 [Streptomyces longisporus]|uniref:Uncharacterized protein n=1 Tax=Streptomyces longisporus TaxID=1948 RepID=A0ABN3MNG5_STRLO
MIVVAVLLLPMLGLLLYGMDRLEDRLLGEPRETRPARVHRLRLVHGVSPSSADRRTAGRHADAA